MISENKFTNGMKKLFVWIVSNTIWTAITYLLPGTLVFPLIYDCFTDKVTVTSVFLMIVGISIEIVVYVFVSKTKKTLKHEEECLAVTLENNVDSENDDFDYFFDEYSKHLTVYSNGNGIIINSFTIIFNNIDAIKPFKRELNINDAKVDTKFPKLKDMQKTNLKDRFKQFGFWCKCSNDDKLIHSIEEKYWTENDEDSDSVNKMNPKDLKWILRMNPSSIEIGKPYKLVYVISIPGMFPIENGIFSDEVANIKGTNGEFNSQFNVRHKIKKFLYTVSFENGINLYTKPKGEIITSGRKKNLHFENENNIIYDKYIFSVDNPDLSSTLNINWNFEKI